MSEGLWLTYFTEKKSYSSHPSVLKKFTEYAGKTPGLEPIFNLVHWKKTPRSSYPKAFCKEFAKFAGKKPELEFLFSLVHWKNLEAVVQGFYVESLKNSQNS